MKSRFTPQEIERVVQESRREGVAVTAYKYEVSEQTLYNWRKRLGVADGFSRLSELKRLQLENARLKRLVAERDLDIDMLKEHAGKNGANLTGRYPAATDTFWREVSRHTASADYPDELGVENKSVVRRPLVKTTGHPNPLAPSDSAPVQNTLGSSEQVPNKL